MEAAYETLQDSVGLTQLSSTMEDVFCSGDLPRAAETLANMRHCSSVTKNESVIRPTEMESEASTLERYHWILDEFNKNKVRQIKIVKEIFQHKHSGLDIGKEEIERIIDGKELGACHMILYIRYLFENYFNGIKDKFKFMFPTQVSPLGQSIDQRAVYVANCLEGNVQNMIYVAPYYFSWLNQCSSISKNLMKCSLDMRMRGTIQEALEDITSFGGLLVVWNLDG